MSKRGISHLLTTMMAVGGVSCIDARDHRLAHDAIRRLRDSADGLEALSTFNVRLDWTPDPEVGLRVPGVTPALWAAVSAGRLTVTEGDHAATFDLTPKESTNARRQLSRLPAGIANAIYQTGTAWAAASTSRKSDARADTSSVDARRVSLA